MIYRWIERSYTPVVACAVAAVVFIGLLVVRPYTRLSGGESDQVAYMVQADIFARGHLTVPAPAEELRTFFRTRHCAAGDRFYGRFWPFTSALYAVPRAAGLSWYVSHALLFALSGLFAGMAVRGTSGGALGAVMAQFGLYGALAQRAWTASSEVTAVAFALLALWMARLLLDRWRIKWAILAGVACAAALMARPLTGLLPGACIGVALLLGAFRQPKRWAVVVVFALCAAVGMGLLMAHSYAVTGNALKPAYNADMPTQAYLFGMRGFQDPIVYFGPKDAMANVRRLADSQWWFSLAACVLIGAVLVRRAVAGVPVVPIALVSGLLLGLAYCCWFDFKNAMARFIVEPAALVVLPFAWIAARIAAWSTDEERPPAATMLAYALVLLFVLQPALLVVLHGATAYQRTQRAERTLAQIDAITGPGPSLVVLTRPEGYNPSERNWMVGVYPNLYNDPWLENERLYAAEREGKTDALYAAFRDKRKVFLVSVDTDTGEVVDLTPDAWRDRRPEAGEGPEAGGRPETGERPEGG